MRKIRKIIIHCSDSDLTADDDISVISGWHYANGWLDVGYHFFITKAGFLQYGRPLWMVGSHCQNQNDDSIGICLSGKEYFGNRQKMTCKMLLSQLYDHFGLTKANVFAHNDFDKSKTCPNFSINELK